MNSYRDMKLSYWTTLPFSEGEAFSIDQIKEAIQKECDARNRDAPGRFSPDACVLFLQDNEDGNPALCAEMRYVYTAEEQEKEEQERKARLRKIEREYKKAVSERERAEYERLKKKFEKSG